MNDTNNKAKLDASNPLTRKLDKSDDLRNKIQEILNSLEWPAVNAADGMDDGTSHNIRPDIPVVNCKDCQIPLMGNGQCPRCHKFDKALTAEKGQI